MAAGLGIKQIMRLGKKQALNFGLAVPAKKSDDPVFVVHRTKASKQLFKEAKDEGNSRRGVCGKMTVSKAEVELTCEVGKPNAVMARRLREQLKDNGFRHKVVFVAPDGERIGEAEDHDNQAAAAALKDPKPNPQPKGTGAREDLPAPAQDKWAGSPPVANSDDTRGVKLDQTLSKLHERIGKVLADHEPAKLKDMQALVEQRRDELKQDSPDFKKIEAFAKQLAQWSKSYKPDAAKAPAGKTPASKAQAAKTPPAGPAQAWASAMTGAGQAMSGAITAQVKDGEKKLAAFTKLLKQQSKGDPKGAIQAKLDKLAGSMASGMMASGANRTAELPAGLDLPPGAGGEVSYSGALGILQGFVEDEMQRARDAKEKADKDEEQRGERQLEAMQDGSYFERTSSYERLHKLAMRLQSGAPEQGDLAELLTFVLRETVRDEDSDKDYNLELARDNMDLAQAAGMMNAGLASGDPERIARAQADLDRALNEAMLTGAFGAIGTASNAAGAAASAAGAAGRTAARGVEAASWAGGMAGAATGMAASNAAGAAAHAAGAAMGAAAGAAGSAAGAAAGAAGAAAGAAGSAVGAAGSTVGTAGSAVGAAGSAVADAASEVPVVGPALGAIGSVVGVAGSAVGAAGSAVGAAGSAVAAEAADGGVQGLAKEAKGLVEQAATRGVTGIFDMFRGIGQMAEEAARAEQPQGNGQGGGTGAGGPLDALGGMVGQGAQMVEQGLAKAVPPAIGFLANFLGLGGIADKIRQVIDKISDALRDRLGAALSWLFEKLDDLLERGDKRHLGFKEMAVWLFDKVVEKKQFVESVGGFLTDRVGQLLEKFKQGLAGLKAKFADLAQDPLTKGEEDARQMLDWLQTRGEETIARMEALVGEAGGPTRADLAKAKKVLAQSKKAAEAEVQERLAALRSEMETLRGQTEGRLDEAWDRGRGKIQDTLERTKGFLEQSYARIEATARETLDRSQAAVSQAWERAKAEMREAVVGTRDEVQAKVDEVKTKVSGKVEEVEAGIERGVETGKLELTGLIDKVETETVRVVQEVETEVQAKVDEVEAKVKAKAAEVDAEIEAAATEVKTAVEELSTELEAEVDRAKAEAEAEWAEVETELTEVGQKLESELKAELKAASQRYRDELSAIVRKQDESRQAIIENI